MDRAAAIDLIRGLVAIPSISGQERPAVDWLVQQMHALGYARAFVDDAGNAVGEIGARDAARLLVLLGHIDTVPGHIPVRIEAASAHPPRRSASSVPPVDDEVLYGRGSVDAKGPLATFVAAGARLDSAWARAANLRVVVVGAVEEEAATSKGARFIASRFDGAREPVPEACVIGEPSRWYRITLGYKGRLILDLVARQPMAHTAGPDASVAMVVVDVWNWIAAHAAEVNKDRAKAFDRLTPSLRRFVTAAASEMDEVVDAQIAWRLPPGLDAGAMVSSLLSWAVSHIGSGTPAPVADGEAYLAPGAFAGGTGVPIILSGARTTMEFRFRGREEPWRGDRQNALVRSFLSAIRSADPTVTPGFVFKTGTSDMNVVAPVWRCPIVAYGPGDSALDHTPHEHVSLDEYWRAVQVLEAAIRRFGDAL